MPETKKYYHNLDVDNNKVINLLLNPLTTAQRLAIGGTLGLLDQGYSAYDTTTDELYFWDGTTWILSSGSSVWGSITGTITAQTDLITYLSSNYVPLNRNITINGVTQDLSVDRTWTIAAGVSSVTASSPLASSGGVNPNITIQQASGSQAGYLSSADWTTFNSKQNPITLTTTGTSGAATFIGNTLNIPQYQAVLTNPVTGTGVATRVAFWDTSSSISSDAELYWDNGGNFLGVGTSNPGGKVTIQTVNNSYALEIRESANNNRGGLLFDTAASNLILSLQNSSGVEKVKLHSNGDTFFNGGNVGIGTISPTYKLDLVGNQSITGYLNFKPTGSAFSISQIKIGSADNIVGGTSTSPNLVLIGQFAGQALSAATTNDSLIGIGYNAGGSITSGGTYSIHVGRNSGNGITTGIRNTHIGSGDMSGIPANTNATIHIIAGGGYELNFANIVLNGLTSKYAFIGGGYNSAEYINDFYLGAGPFVTQPQNANLNLYAPSGAGTDLVGSHFTINAGRGTGTGTPGDIFFTTSTATTTGTTVQTLSSRMVVKGETGNVGIGTITPGYKLEVVASGVSAMFSPGGSINYIQIGASTSSYINMHGGSGERKLLIGNGATGYADLITYNNNTLRISYGDVGLPTKLTTFTPNFSFSGGTNTHTIIDLFPNINITGGTNTLRGIYYNPNNTAGTATTEIAWENTQGDIIHGNLATGGADQMVTVDTNGKLKKQTIPTGGSSRSVNPVSVNTAAGSASGTDYVYLVSGTTTITLPTPVGNTNLYTIKRVGTNTVSIATTSGTIDGSASPITINVQYVSLDLISDGTDWHII